QLDWLSVVDSQGPTDILQVSGFFPERKFKIRKAFSFLCWVATGFDQRFLSGPDSFSVFTEKCTHYLKITLPGGIANAIDEQTCNSDVGLRLFHRIFNLGEPFSLAE